MQNRKSLKELERTAEDMLKTINDLIDALVELRESSALIDKLIIDELCPIPAETLSKPPKKLRKAKKQREKDLQEVLEVGKDLVGSSASTSCVDKSSSACSECCACQD